MTRPGLLGPCGWETCVRRQLGHGAAVAASRVAACRYFRAVNSGPGSGELHSSGSFSEQHEAACPPRLRNVADSGNIPPPPIREYLHLSTHVDTRMHTDTHTHTYTHTDVMHANTWTQAHTRGHGYTNTRTDVQTRTHTYSHTHMHTDTHTHTGVHTLRQMHTHGQKSMQ